MLRFLRFAFLLVYYKKHIHIFLKTQIHFKYISIFKALQSTTSYNYTRLRLCSQFIIQNERESKFSWQLAAQSEWKRYIKKLDEFKICNTELPRHIRWVQNLQYRTHLPYYLANLLLPTSRWLPIVNGIFL